jgi:steroid 5-alpha reductase family enzyme
MSGWQSLVIVWLLAIVMMSAGWLWQRKRSNIGMVDVLWAAGLGGSALLLALLGDGAGGIRTALAIFGGLWGARLALHLWHRVRGEAEDGRYRHLREHWQGHQGKIFGFFQFQALLIVLFALPFLAVARNPNTSVIWAAIAAVIWICSVVGEAIADRQLMRFRADPAHRGRTCRNGLWHYSRHPNYFFEWLHWFTYVALAVGSPIAWLAWSGPIVMFVFLRWISGIPYTEQQALRTRGDDYRQYQQSTPMLFPWFPDATTSARTRKQP